MASENPEAQEAAFKETSEQEDGGETSNKPVKEKEATAKQGFSNLLAVLLCDHSMEQYHVLRPPPSDNQIRPLNNRPIAWKQGLVLGSVEGGWLILYRTFSLLSVIISGYEDECLCYNHISLVNPLSGVRLRLPPEPCFLIRKDYKPQIVADVVTSNCSPHSPEFLVVAFFMNSGRHWLAFSKIGDESWTHIADVKHIRDANILVRLALALDDKNKLLYFVHLHPSATNYDMMVFDLKDSKNIKMKRLLMAESDNLPRQEIFTPATSGEGRILTNLNIGDRRLHLTADSSRGDLFMILQKNDVDGSTNILPVEGFRVYIKVDEGGPQWKDIQDLGDRSIFISHLGSKVISAAELNSKSEGLFRRSCIYFALQNAFQCEALLRRDIGVCSLTDGTIKRVSLPSKYQKDAVATLWFDPVVLNFCK